MKILVACDKFKGSLTGSEACETIAEGLRAVLPAEKNEIRCFPIADGGEGMASALLEARGGQWIEHSVRGPLGDPVSARYALLEEERIAVIEMASASGLTLLQDRPKDPLRASSYGTGQLLRHAIQSGVSEIILGIGGSATNDGGTGMAEALGYRFLRGDGSVAHDLPLDLENIEQIVGPSALKLPPITVACDVANPLLGPNGCTAIYGPQKGILSGDIAHHEARLAHLVKIQGEKGKQAAKVPGSGAAGGLGFGAILFLKAKLHPGFDLMAEYSGFASAVAWADHVITGEGRLDTQSLEGKGPYGVVQLARSHGKSTSTFCGSLEDATLEGEFGPIIEIRDPKLSLSVNISRGREHLYAAAKSFAESLLSPQSNTFTH